MGGAETEQRDKLDKERDEHALICRLSIFSCQPINRT
jgi:hypothetical protein